MIEEILKDDSAYIVGAITILASIFVAYWVVKKQQEYKSINYMIDSYYDLVSDSIKESGLKIFHNDSEYKNAALLILELKNDGVLPIEPRDFSKNMQLVFSDNTEVLSMEVISKKPENLDITFSSDENITEFEPFLLNKDESFKLKALLGNNKEFEVKARISGITEINEIKPYDGIEGYKYIFSKYKKSFFKYIVIMAAPLIASLYLYNIYLAELSNDDLIVRIVFVLFVISIVSDVADNLFVKFIHKQNREKSEDGNEENEANK